MGSKLLIQKLLSLSASKCFFCRSIYVSACSGMQSYVNSAEDLKNGNKKDENSFDFGFQKVSDSEKSELVKLVFKNVASQYDKMNDVMSLGVHRLWKDYFVQTLNPRAPLRILDVAGGTGDIAFRFLEHLKKQGAPLSEEGSTELGLKDPNFSHVMVCDLNESMLRNGRKKATELGYTKGISWVQGNAEDLPLADNSIDAYTISFGIRNVTHVDKALKEAHRVLKPGGRFLCLEFGHVKNPIVSRFYDLYSLQVIPVMGEVVAADFNSYKYLVESIRTFYNQEQFCALMESAGFKRVTHEDLTFGIAVVYSGFKL